MGGWRLKDNQNPLYSPPHLTEWGRGRARGGNCLPLVIQFVYTLCTVYHHTQSKSFICYILMFNIENDCLPNFWFFFS